VSNRQHSSCGKQNLQDASCGQHYFRLEPELLYDQFLWNEVCFAVIFI
jgi:hypothetical protein